MELFKNKSSFRRLVLVCAIQASVQMTGVSAIQYYSPTIFSNMGIKTNDTLKYQGISSVLALIAQLCCILFIDKVGRRWAMIGGNLTNCLFFTIATIMLARFPPGATENASASWAFIAMTWLYNISFSAPLVVRCFDRSWLLSGYRPRGGPSFCNDDEIRMSWSNCIHRSQTGDRRPCKRCRKSNNTSRCPHASLL